MKLLANAGKVLLAFFVIALFLQADAADKAPRAWSIVATYNIPNDASGLAWDGANLYCGIYGTNGGNVYKINPSTGVYTLQCTGPQEDCYGLTWDGTNFWTTDHPGSSSSPAVAICFNLSGVQQTSFNLPTHYMSGIAYDNGNFWSTRYYPDPGVAYKTNSSGTILKQFNTPNNQPWDVCMENGRLWIADYWGDMLYAVDTATGAVLDSHASENVDPAGIVFDGTYLWYCDEGASSSYDVLYKVNLGGAGTPDINFPLDAWDYGIVTVGNAPTWMCMVENLGTAPIAISGISISGSTELACSATFPLNIPAGESATLPIKWTPTAIGPLNAIVGVNSNDPITPIVNLTLTGDAVNPGPDILMPVSAHNYGTVRVRSYPLWTMLIVNSGDAALSVSAITADDPVIHIDGRVTFPISIPPLDTVKIPVWFFPQSPILYKPTISIVTNDPDESPFLVDVEGTGLQTEWGMGDTLWSYQINDPFDSSPRAMAPIADINGDGVSDVIVCSEGYVIRAFNGNASGAGDVIWENEFASGYVYNQNSIVVIPDIDEDTYPDVVVGTSGRFVRALSGRTGNQIWNYSNDEFGGGGWIYQVDARFDYNNDGSIDVLAASGDDGDDTGPKRVHCLNGLSGAPIWHCPFSGPVFGVTGVADLNGDGKADAVAGSSSADETVGYVTGINGVNGGVLWSRPVSGSSVWSIEQLGDVNSDGTLDVMAGDFSFSSGALYVIDGKSGVNLQPPVGVGSVIRLQSIGDINGDGYPDIMPAQTSAQAFAASGTNANALWSQPVSDKPWCVSAANDISGDGIKDIMLGTLYVSNNVYFINGATGAVLKSVPYSSPIDGLHSIPDIVGDASYEMLAGGREGELVCFSGGTNASSNQAPNQASSPNPPNSGTGVPVSANLTWVGSDPNPGDALGYDVYFGTTNPPAIASNNQPAASYNPPGNMTSGQQYYWRIDTRDQHGALTTGALWSFTTASYLCGDADGNALVTISDAVYTINYIFSGGPAPNPLAAGDADCNGLVTISDVVYLINYIFSGGPAPCATCK